MGLVVGGEKRAQGIVGGRSFLRGMTGNAKESMEQTLDRTVNKGPRTEEDEDEED